MTLALLFLIVVAVALLVATAKIWKSGLKDNDKIIAVISLMGFFSFLSIANEYSRSSAHTHDDYSGIPNFFAFNELFFSIRKLTVPKLFPTLPPMKSRNEQLARTFDSDCSLSSPSFCLLEGGPNQGKTDGVLRYAQDLVSRDSTTPIVYFDLRTQLHDLDPLFLGPSVRILEDQISSLNQKAKVPGIVFDNFDRILHLPNTQVAQVLESLVKLYDRHHVAILLISNRPFLRDRLMSAGSSLFYSRRNTPRPQFFV